MAWGISFKRLAWQRCFSYQKGEYDGAVVVTKNALAIGEMAHGPDHSEAPTSLESTAALYRAAEGDEEAAQLEQRAAKIRATTR